MTLINTTATTTRRKHHPQQRHQNSSRSSSNRRRMRSFSSTNTSSSSSSSFSFQRWIIGTILTLIMIIIMTCTTTMTTAQRLDCNPCVQRNEYIVKVITHGTSSNMKWKQTQLAMIQTAKDMGGITLEFDLYDNNDNDNNMIDTTILDQMVIDIETLTVQLQQQQQSNSINRKDDDDNNNKIQDEQQAESSSNNNNNNNNNIVVDVLIVTIPNDERIHTAIRALIKTTGIPVFAFSTGHEIAATIDGILGYIGQDDYIAGQIAALTTILQFQKQQQQQLQQQSLIDTTTTNESIITNFTTTNTTTTMNNTTTLPSSTTTTTKIKNALFVNHDIDNPTYQERFQGWKDTLLLQQQQQQDHQSSSSSSSSSSSTTLNNNTAVEENDEISITELPIDLTDLFGIVQIMSDVFQDCTYDTILIADGTSYEAVNVVLRAIAESECYTTTTTTTTTSSSGSTTSTTVQNQQQQQQQRPLIIGTFEESNDIFNAMIQGDLSFTISQQDHIQSVIPIVLGSLYAMTGYHLALPKQKQQQQQQSQSLLSSDNNGDATIDTSHHPPPPPPPRPPVFQSGPHVITLENLPSDTQQICASESFPVCSITNNNNNNNNALLLGGQGEEGTEPSSSSTPSTSSSTTTTQCKCLDRSTIRIGGVLHGVSNDSPWDIVFAAAYQTASDLGIELDLERFQPESDSDIILAKMANKISTLCASGVDGIFISIPSGDELIPSIQECQALNIPIISTNSGAIVSGELNLLQHVGMLEYTAGYEAARRMITAGMTTAYCIIHERGNSALEERCQGFQDAIIEYQQQQQVGGVGGGSGFSSLGEDLVTFEGVINVPLDIQAQFKLTVEAAVGESSNNNDEDNNDWKGIGLLLTGGHVVPAAKGVREVHPKLLLGSFDTSEDIIQGIEDGSILFGIEQQLYLQGSIPIYLLTYAAHTGQVLGTRVMETGPSFVTSVPSEEQTICEANFFEACSLHPVEDYQYISPALIDVGYVFVGMIMMIAISSLVWIVRYKEKSPIVKVSQPLLLMLVIFGSVLSSLSIITMGQQTQYRYSEIESFSGDVFIGDNPEIRSVDLSCMSTWWLYGVGFAIMFSALFAKIRLVKSLYNTSVSLRRKTVQLKEVASILVILVAFEVTILVAWQIVSPEQWERHVTLELDGYVVESVGKCTSESGWCFAVALSSFHGLCLLYALVLCFQTKHIPSDFAESNWISLAVLCMFQILVIAIPIYLMVEEDTNVFYFVRVCVVFLQNFTVICLIFGPKMVRVFTGQDQLSVPYGPRLTSSLGSVDTRLYSNRQSGRGGTDKCFYCGNTIIPSGSELHSSFAEPGDSPVESSIAMGRSANLSSIAELGPVGSEESSSEQQLQSNTNPQPAGEVHPHICVPTLTTSGDARPLKDDMTTTENELSKLNAVYTEQEITFERCGENEATSSEPPAGTLPHNKCESSPENPDDESSTFDLNRDADIVLNDTLNHQERVDKEVATTTEEIAKVPSICVICTRKFPSLEALKLHEESDLHKRNLAKL